VAPGLTAVIRPSDDPEPALRLSTVPFRVEATHDLLQNGDLFGLRSVTDTTRGHFPAISPVPFAIGQARQEAVAEFTEEGFKAAVVTAMAVVPGAAAWEPSQERLEVTVTFDRPFAFVAIHRPSRLVLVAGWVADPQPAGGDRDPV
jgi:serine protease inhibitor